MRELGVVRHTALDASTQPYKLAAAPIEKIKRKGLVRVSLSSKIRLILSVAQLGSASRSGREGRRFEP
jgi:hypothetical protein